MENDIFLDLQDAFEGLLTFAFMQTILQIGKIKRNLLISLHTGKLYI